MPLSAASMPIYLVPVIVVAAFHAEVAKGYIPLIPVPLLLSTLVGRIVPYLAFIFALRLGMSGCLVLVWSRWRIDRFRLI